MVGERSTAVTLRSPDGHTCCAAWVAPPNPAPKSSMLTGRKLGSADLSSCSTLRVVAYQAEEEAVAAAKACCSLYSKGGLGRAPLLLLCTPCLTLPRLLVLLGGGRPSSLLNTSGSIVWPPSCSKAMDASYSACRVTRPDTVRGVDAKGPEELYAAGAALANRCSSSSAILLLSWLAITRTSFALAPEEAMYRRRDNSKPGGS
mmetsp:Transcript_22143/g.61257  ORF Transcript_22143/g.61257 Transcript_22143/m.61257 type:complete len:203 (-) Transcript_22143:338-946(-)